MNEPTAQFEDRKKDHLRIALDPKAQALGFAGFDSVSLIPEALPELDFSEINYDLELFGQRLRSPIFISSMTAGNSQSLNINLGLARAAQERGWMMAVGSQRRELIDKEAASEWSAIRSQFPELLLVGNIGISQLTQVTPATVQGMVDRLGARALFVHLNALQECLQPEGTPNFRGSLDAIKRLAQELNVPVLLKEVGCGFSQATLNRLRGSGVYAVDVAGLGGTHWGRIEGERSPELSAENRAAQVFKDWGIPTVNSLSEGMGLQLDYKLWASGGVRSGLDVAKLLAMGAEMVGVAQPLLQSVLKGQDALQDLMEQFEYELKIAMFCSGCRTLQDLRAKGVWKWK